MKREALLKLAHRAERNRRVLLIIAGIMALLSGASMTAIFVELVSSTAVKVSTAVLTFGAGLINLLTNAEIIGGNYKEMYKGASEFLMLRDAVRLEGVRMEQKGLLDPGSLKKLNEKYGQLSGTYDRYIAPFSSSVDDHMPFKS